MGQIYLVHTLPSHFCETLFNIILKCVPSLLKGCPLKGFMNKIYTHSWYFSYTPHLPYILSFLIWSNFWLGVQIMNFISHFTPSFCHFIPLRSKYSSLDLTVLIPQSARFSELTRYHIHKNIVHWMFQQLEHYFSWCIIGNVCCQQVFYKFTGIAYSLSTLCYSIHVHFETYISVIIRVLWTIIGLTYVWQITLFYCWTCCGCWLCQWTCFAQSHKICMEQIITQICQKHLYSRNMWLHILPNLIRHQKNGACIQRDCKSLVFVAVT